MLPMLIYVVVDVPHRCHGCCDSGPCCSSRCHHHLLCIFDHHHLLCFCSPLQLLLPLFYIASAYSCSCCLQATIATVITITIIVLHQLFSLPCCCHGAKVATLAIIVAATVLLVLTLLLSASSSIGQLHLMPSLLP